MNPLAAGPLAARCTAEAHLYLDLRGYLPQRSERMLQTGDGPLLVLGGSVPDERDWSELAFSVAVPHGMLGAGGVAGPSSIIGPAEFLVWASILSKRNPADPEGLAPWQREIVKQEMTRAAECMEELLKFIPPGQGAVPPEAFRTPAARRVFDKEPGRFQGARLEAVATAYRRVTARFCA